MTDRRWYAVMTQPQREAWAWQHLLDRDFEAFLPRFVERRGHPWRGAVYQAQLLPGYLFLHAPAMIEWHLVLEAPCVTGIVRANGDPLPARDGVVETMQALTHRGDGTLWFEKVRVAPKPGKQPTEAFEMRAGPIPTRSKRRRDEPTMYERGQILRIVEGPFTSFTCVYLGGEGDQLQLMVDIFGRGTVTELSEAQVTPV